MDARTHQQLQLIANSVIDATEERVKAQNSSILRRQSAAGMLRSGNTISMLFISTSDIFLQVLDQLKLQILTKTSAPEGFDVLSAAAARMKAAGSSALVLAMAPLGEMLPATQNAVRALHERLDQKIDQELAIARFDFPADDGPEQGGAKPVAPLHNKTGRPAHDFWDALWSATAIAIYDGSLIPKRQADIEKFMARWLVDHGHHAADSSVRKRARVLWGDLSNSV